MGRGEPGFQGRWRKFCFRHRESEVTSKIWLREAGRKVGHFRWVGGELGTKLNLEEEGDSRVEGWGDLEEKTHIREV